MRRHDTGPVPYPLALVITLAVEVPIYLVVFRAARLMAGWRGVGAAVGVNLATHPVLWLTVSAHPCWLLPAEAAVCLVEAGLLWCIARRDAVLLLVTSVAANSASILAGTVLYGLTLQ
jgi:hypothetical protein